MEALKNNIKNMSLTKKEKIIADYLLDNLNSIGFCSVKEVANACQVSDTSVIRFLRNLGYSGYADFKKALNEQMVEQYNSNLSPMQKFNQSKSRLRKESIVADVFLNSINNLNNGLLQIDVNLMDNIAECMIGCEKKYIAAFRGTSCCAQYFYRKAIYFMSGLTLCDKAESETLEKLMDITEKDCLMMFSYPRYSEINFQMLEIAKAKKAKVILFTDRVTSPLAQYADYLVTTDVSGPGYTNSYVVPLCCGEALAVLISKKLENCTEERLDLLEKCIYQTRQY